MRREADFYGAMDGAIRFTQRDALAAVLITGVNIVAGLIIGVFQHGLDLGTAAQTYTILTVGEGLVTAIPALLVSMSGGLITTRAGVRIEPRRGRRGAVARARPAAGRRLGRAARARGDPGAAEVLLHHRRPAPRRGRLRQSQAQNGRTRGAADATTVAPEAVDGMAVVDPLSVEVGYALVALVDEKQGGTLLNRVRAIRRQIATETGVVVPPVHVADNLQLPPRAYSILVKGVEVARGELFADRLLAINPGTADTVLDGTATREPAFGLPAVWISNEQREHASAAGFTVVDPTTALSTHLSETIRGFLPDLLSRQQTKELVDRVGADVAEADRGARAEARVDRRRPAGAAAAAARARVDPGLDDDPRGGGRRGGD